MYYRIIDTLLWLAEYCLVLLALPLVLVISIVYSLGYAYRNGMIVTTNFIYEPIRWKAERLFAPARFLHILRDKVGYQTLAARDTLWYKNYCQDRYHRGKRQLLKLKLQIVGCWIRSIFRADDQLRRRICSLEFALEERLRSVDECATNLEKARRKVSDSQHSATGDWMSKITVT